MNAEEDMVLEGHDPDGRRVVLTEGAWSHIRRRHPEMDSTAAAILACVERPDHREDDPWPGREDFWRRGLGPSRWLFAVVDFEQEPARIVTAYGRRDDPPGWWAE